MMMSIRFKIWKQLIANETPLSCHRPAIAAALPLVFYAKSHIQVANFCNQMATPCTTPLDRGVVTEFLISKCGLTDDDIKKAFRSCSSWLWVKSSQNMEEVLELLNGCGLSTPEQVRRVVVFKPKILFYRSDRIIKSKLSFIRTFMREEDIPKLILRDPRMFDVKEDRLKSAASVLQRLGIQGKELLHLVLKEPHLLSTSEEKVIESFKQAENLGLKKGSKKFATAIQAILGLGKEKLERKRHFLSGLGFTEKQILELYRREPRILELSEEKLKRNVDFVVNSVGIPFDVFMSCPTLFSLSLEKRIIPRYRVMEALKSMQVQALQREMPHRPIVCLTEKAFLEKYVNKSAESSVLRDIYYGEETGKLIIDKEECSESVSTLKQRDS